MNGFRHEGRKHANGDPASKYAERFSFMTAKIIAKSEAANRTNKEHLVKGKTDGPSQRGGEERRMASGVLFC
jgi:hypothetical protein